MRNQRGYTLTEIMIAAGLSGLVVASTIGFMFYFFNEKSRLDNWSSGQIEMSMAIKHIERDIRNIARLEPVEDLRAANDNLYFGLTSIPVGEEPSICFNNATSSVFRYTTLARNVKQEKSLRAWSELNSADKTTAADELRLSIEDNDKALFSDKNKPSEILIVDADRRFIRRYAVVSSTKHLNSTTDPYDDATRTDINGNVLKFNYVSVLLARPTGLTGNKVTIRPAVFVTGSDVYSAHTYIVCLRKSDMNLIKYDPIARTEEIILRNSPPSFSVQTFVVGYLGTATGVRVDPANFISNTFTDTAACINSMSVSLTAENQSTDTSGSKDTKTGISRDRTIFATNLSSRRPASCLE
jgi:hypothetical protein